MKKIYKTFSIAVLLLLCACEAKIPPLSSNATVLVFGDSLAAGKHEQNEINFPTVLGALSGLNVINAGVVGESTGEGLSRLSGLLSQYKPELLILCHGGEDFLKQISAAQVEANVREMIALAEAREIPVLLMGVPDPTIFIKSADLYKTIALDTNTVFLEDIVSDVMARPAMNLDEVYPNETGYKIIATEIFQALQKMNSI